MNLCCRTNLPKEVMAFPDFPFDKELPSFIGHMDVRKYLDAYADHFDLKRFIQVRIFLTIRSETETFSAGGEVGRIEF